MAYVSNKLSLLCQYEKILKEKYQSSAKTVDFGASEQVRQEINAAVEKETNSRIKDLIPSGTKLGMFVNCLSQEEGYVIFSS